MYIYILILQGCLVKTGKYREGDEFSQPVNFSSESFAQAITEWYETL